MRKRFWMRALFALIAIGLLMGSIGGAFRAGMWQGYQMGQATASSEEGTAPDWGLPWMPHGRVFGYGRGPYMMPYSRFGGYRPFGLLRPLLTFVLMVFLFGLAAKSFGFWAWKRAWKKTGKDWRRAWACGHPAHGHWHGPRGPMPPWACDDSESSEEEPSEEQVVKVKPDADTTEDES